MTPHNNNLGHLGAAKGSLPDDNKPLPGSIHGDAKSLKGY